MATEVLMPKLGLTMTEGTIEEWKFSEGSAVKKGDILFSVATDKLTNDIECETDGVLIKILYPEGETAPCKSVIAYIGASGEAAPCISNKEASGETETVCTDAYTPATPYAKLLAKKNGIDISDVSGTGPKGAVVARDIERAERSSVKASPMAVKLAAEHGIDLNTVSAAGRVKKADVLNAVKLSEHTEAAPEEESNDLPPIKVAPLRRAIASNMSLSWATSPSVTFTYAVDVTSMKELRAKLKEPMNAIGIKLTYNHILMKIVATVLTEFPDINASFSDNMLTRHRHVNMGLAVAKDDGLIVPNVKKADLKSLVDIARETEALIDAARSGSVSMEDISGGTFTITSLGAFGVRSFSPIINQPELAILGVGNIEDTPVVIDGQIVIRPMMNLCLTADHRVIDGVQACRFMQRIVQILENPYLLLAQ